MVCAVGEVEGEDEVSDTQTLSAPLTPSSPQKSNSQKCGIEGGVRNDCLYPTVSEAETPLPRQWSSEDKAAQIELSRNDRRAHGPGSVRAAHPIPIDCPGYYFEVDIVSRSAVVGLSAASTTNGNSMDR